jgi:hypothetical protein
MERERWILAKARKNIHRHIRDRLQTPQKPQTEKRKMGSYQSNLVSKTNGNGL